MVRNALLRRFSKFLEAFFLVLEVLARLQIKYASWCIAEIFVGKDNALEILLTYVSLHLEKYNQGFLRRLRIFRMPLSKFYRKAQIPVFL